MAMVMLVNTLDLEILNHVSAYLAGDQPLDEFEAWFVGASWDDRSYMAAAIDHTLAERSQLSKSEFDGRLAEATRVLDAQAPEKTGTVALTLEKVLDFVSMSTTTRAMNFSGT